MYQVQTPTASSTTALSLFTTDALVFLAYGLSEYESGAIRLGSDDWEELVSDQNLHAVQTALGITDTTQILSTVVEVLEARHTEMRDRLAAYRVWDFREITLGTALLDAADVIREYEMMRLLPAAA